MATVTITISDVKGGEIRATMDCDPPIKRAGLDDPSLLSPAQGQALVVMSGLLSRAEPRTTKVTTRRGKKS